MDIFYNVTRQCRVDADNCRLAGNPVLYFGASPEWVLHLYTGEPGETPVPLDASGIPAFRAAVDVDWTASTEPMCRTVSGIDVSGAASGVIVVPIDANTVRFGQVLNGARSKDAYFELRGLDTNGDVALLILFPVTCHNVIDPEGGEPPEDTPSGYATEAYVDAVVSRELYVEFSADGESWHTSLTTGDLYERIKHGSTGEWSDAFAIPYGPQGPQGDQGATGATGPQGETGPSGPAPTIDAENGHWLIDGVDTGVDANAQLLSAYTNVSSVSATNTYPLRRMPLGVVAPSGHYYPVEKLNVTISGTTYTLDFTPFLAYENMPTFSGTWKVYYAGGPQGDTAMPISSPDSLAIAPEDNHVYRHTLAASDVITFDTTGLSASSQITWELHLTQPSTAVSFTLPSGVLWPDAAGLFASANTPPDMTTGGMIYVIVFRWDGANLLGNLAYRKEVPSAS
ncbi:MAG: collagen-like protein [Lentisphaeria bacterium]|nr:collagen-like protein [Lentisphaeria bacterium]